MDWTVYSTAVRWRLWFFLFVFLPLKYLQRIAQWIVGAFWKHGGAFRSDAGGVRDPGQLNASRVVSLAHERSAPSRNRREYFEIRC